ncbi:carboxypeptidase-like regulatory domain-containing protein [Pedobacter sp. SL55]|uniref:carboxypeptidase-like regulatory domain-containing protein n=1 Tax=Pedobacter sp. SL55 TaxID=2995161 RepID=UPI002271879F|nr:carboxypeptidase-like regulatory domain-containing protein [Pedobacter sp. SL55]WAC42148.1 carboxypeptidase-like regulatory domain-containing protein [Pedobacter sp. SL55]
MVGARIAAPVAPVQALESRVEGIQIKTDPYAKSVKGTVYDVYGRPLSGADVKMVGDDIRAITNKSGEFTLPVDKEKVTLEVTSLGFASKNIEAKANQDVNVRLDESNSGLSEVVAVGYGKAKKKATTTAKEAAEEVNVGVPEMGWKAYNEYLTKNNKLLADGSKAVILSFKLSADAMPNDVKVVKSEGKAMDEEANRLLKNGGKWKFPTGKSNTLSISIKF